MGTVFPSDDKGVGRVSYRIHTIPNELNDLLEAVPMTAKWHNVIKEAQEELRDAASVEYRLRRRVSELEGADATKHEAADVDLD